MIKSSLLREFNDQVSNGPYNFLQSFNILIRKLIDIFPCIIREITGRMSETIRFIGSFNIYF